jgi:hypothetical protein
MTLTTLTAAEVGGSKNRPPLGANRGAGNGSSPHAQPRTYPPSAQVKAAAAQVGDFNWSEEEKNYVAYYMGNST